MNVMDQMHQMTLIKQVDESTMSYQQHTMGLCQAVPGNAQYLLFPHGSTCQFGFQPSPEAPHLLRERLLLLLRLRDRLLL